MHFHFAKGLICFFMFEIIFGLVGCWLLLELKTSRSDGVLVKDLHPYRKIMQFVMPTRTESVVFFDVNINTEKLLPYLNKAKVEQGATLLHVIVAALNRGLEQNPKLNRFVMGRRIYQRKGRAITFSAKRKKGQASSKLAMVKMDMKDQEPFTEIVTRINRKLGVERSDAETYADKEYAMFNLLPRPVLLVAVKLFRLLDYYNLLPGFFIEGDALYASAIVTNLGSLQMAPGYHHLYEWGNCPLFVMVGAMEERVCVKDGKMSHQKILPIRLSYDDRVEDGLTARKCIEDVVAIIEDPAAFFLD